MNVVIGCVGENMITSKNITDIVASLFVDVETVDDLDDIKGPPTYDYNRDCALIWAHSDCSPVELSTDFSRFDTLSDLIYHVVNTQLQIEYECEADHVRRQLIQGRIDALTSEVDRISGLRTEIANLEAQL